MVYPELTALYGSVLAILFALLSLWVVAGRVKFGILHSDGGDEHMSRRIRAQGNFSEYVPMILLLTAFLEIGGLSRGVLHALLAPLLLARLMHPFGMLAPVASMQQYVLRGGSAIVTLAVLVIVACILLGRVAFA
jgi:uncharacterized membrane protein YecN with MAPEG domain